MSAKNDCDNHGHHCERRRRARRAFACIVGFIILVLFVILVVWLVLRPTKPKFYLQDAKVYQFNLSGSSVDSNALTSTVQITVSSRNPNDRIGIYYDRLRAYATYQHQQVTGATEIPAGYQGHNDVTVWSPYLSGYSVPVGPYVCGALAQDENAGFLLLYVKIQGKLRWKVGSWISGRYHVDVSCPVFLTVGAGGSSYQFQHISTCGVDV